MSGSRIARVDALPLVYDEPHAFGASRAVTVVRIEDADGAVGWGEAVCGAAEAAVAVRAIVVKGYAPLLLGADPSAIRALWDRLRDRSALLPYLRAAVVNRCRSAHRGRARVLRTASPLTPELVVLPGADTAALANDDAVGLEAASAEFERIGDALAAADAAAQAATCHRRAGRNGSGLTASAPPKIAAAAPIRPPRRRYSSVST